MIKTAGLCAVVLVIAAGCTVQVQVPQSALPVDQVADSPGAAGQGRPHAVGWDMRFPNHHYITAWGMSPASLRDAELDARKAVSEQIVSSIRGETETWAAAFSRDGEIRDEQWARSQVFVTTEFDHAEMIRVEQGSADRDDAGNHVVFAWLDRDELGELYAVTYGTDAEVFRRSAEAALEEDRGIDGFTTAWRRAESAFRSMSVAALRYKVVTRTPMAGQDGDKALYRRLVSQRTALLARVGVAVSVQGQGDLDGEFLTAAVCESLASLGVRATGGPCYVGVDIALDLQSRLREVRSIGTHVELSLSGGVKVCATGNDLAMVNLSGEPLIGYGNDPMRNLRKKVTPESLAPLLQKSLSGILPI